MSEVNGPKFSVNQINYSGISKQPQETPSETIEQQESPKLNDFSDPKAEVIGRSMLLKGADDTKHDLKALIESPQIAENSDKMFETAFKAARESGLENSYEAAASFATGAVTIALGRSSQAFSSARKENSPLSRVIFPGEISAS